MMSSPRMQYVPNDWKFFQKIDDIFTKRLIITLLIVLYQSILFVPGLLYLQKNYLSHQPIAEGLLVI